MSDELLEPCPGCSRDIDVYAISCPYCRFDLMHGKPADKPKPAKEPKVKSKKDPKQQQQKVDRSGVKVSPGRSTIYIPALGRHGRAPIDFPELYWPKHTPINDDNLVAWAEQLRAAYSDIDTMGSLSNHAIYYFANTSKDRELKDNADRILDLIGGDDW